MDLELTQAIAKLQAQISDVGRDARAAAQSARETAHMNVQVLHRVQRLETQVFGSDPPPSNSARIVTRVSETELEMDEVRGRIIAIDGRCVRIEKELEKQSRQMGITKKTTWKDYVRALVSPSGRRSLVRLATLAGALYAAFQATGKGAPQPAGSAAPMVTVPSGGNR